MHTHYPLPLFGKACSQKKNNVYGLFFLIPFLLARLLFPFEIVNKTNFIQVSKVLPSIIQFFRTELLGLPFPAQGLHISINMITLATLFLPFISVLRCLKVTSRYYYLYKRLKYISPSHDERILKILADIQEKRILSFQSELYRIDLLAARLNSDFLNRRYACLSSIIRMKNFISY